MQAWILEVINGIANKSLRPDIVRIFLRGERRKIVADDRGIREDLLRKQLLRELKKAVTPRQIRKYNEIKRKMEEIASN